MLCKDTWPNWRGKPQDGVRVILERLKVERSEVAYGHTKIFIRNPPTVSYDNDDGGGGL